MAKGNIMSLSNERENIKDIKLQDYLKKGNKGLKEAGKILNQGGIRVDCSDVDELSDQQIKLLLSSIKNLKTSNDVDEFIDVDTTSDNLRSQIAKYFQKTEQKNSVFTFTLGIALLAAISILALGSVSWLGWKYFRFSAGLRVKTTNLTIGILTDVKDYKPLEEYLESRLIPDDFAGFLKGDKIKVIIDGDRKIKYQEARSRIVNKEWDIAFTLSPMNSLAAKDNGYLYVARMFPGQPSFYQSALFVSSKNNNLKSLEDIKPTTTIALGEITSASSFFMPAYDLYGKTLTVKKGNRGPDIIKMVKNGDAEIGAGAFGDTIKNDTAEIRIISISRNIPGASVYLSPKLLEQDRNSISKALALAPQDIQKKANYIIEEEPDYSSFLGIARRVEEILQCSDFDKNPVNFFCPEPSNPNKSTKTVLSKTTFTGKVNGYQNYSRDFIWLNVETPDGKIYRVVITPTLLNQIPNAGSPLNMKNKKIEMTNVTPNVLEGNILEIVINDASQLRVP
jgi:ABC-type phosphate/phosphonate transport system substrate-binding protein